MEKMNSALGFLEVGGNLKYLKDQDGVERVYVQDEDGKLTCLGTIEEYERSKPLIEAFYNATQEQIATQCGISRQYYGFVEQGDRNVPVKTAKKIAEVLGFDWQKFFE